MIYLLLSIVASTCVLVVFRMMQTVGANTRHAITLSYLVSAVFGYLLFSPDATVVFRPWFWPAAIEGAAFYIVFRLIGKTTQLSGVAVTSMATKMSVVIPVGIGIILFNESADIFKLTGLLAGICAVLLSAGGDLRMKQALWPILAFLGTGMIDASFKLLQVWLLSEQEFPAFVTTVFVFAFIVGLFHHFFCADNKVQSASMLAGLALGIVNFGTVFFLLKALAQPDWESSIIYAVNNIGVVVLSTIVAILVFRERLNLKSRYGLAIAVVSIGLLYRSSLMH